MEETSGFKDVEAAAAAAGAALFADALGGSSGATATSAGGAGGAAAAVDGEGAAFEEEDFVMEKQEAKSAMMVKSFKGALIPPSEPVPRSTLPDASLRLEHVTGYRCKGTRSNVHALQTTGEVVYAAAGLGVVADPYAQKQRFLEGHTDDVLSVAVDPSSQLIATGAIGARPDVKIWSSETGACIANFAGIQRRAIVALAFSPDGAQIASIGNDDRHRLVVYNVADGGGRRKATPIISEETDTSRVLCLAWNPHPHGGAGELGIVTGGIKHLKTWGERRGKFAGRMASFGSGSRPSIVSLTFTEDFLWAGTAKGTIFMFNAPGARPIRKIKAHTGAVYALAPTERGSVASGGRDGKISLWSSRGKAHSSHIVTAAASGKHPGGVCALSWYGEDLFVGTNRGEVLLVQNVMTGKADTQMVTEGHYDGEVWAVCPYPDPDINLVASGGDDNTLRIWDASTYEMLAHRTISDRAVAGRVRGASTMGSFAPNQMCRALDWHPFGEFIAAGLCNGHVLVVQADDMSLNTVARIKDRKQWIQTVRYSPDGEKLAVGSHDNFIDIYDATDYTRLVTCAGHSSFITHIDWDMSASVLKSTCGAYELLFWDAETGRQMTSGATEMRDAEWATYTTPLGWAVQGIWPGRSGYEGADLSDIDAVDRSPGADLLAVADDHGKVNLFSFPAHTMPNAPKKSYSGHCSHVTNVRFSADGTRVFSVGGNDCALITWAVE